jgi:hypothetical protein
MLYRFDLNAPRASVGCGLLLALLGIILLTPLVDLLIGILGWTFIVLGLIFVVLGVSSWLFGSGRRFG